MPFSVSRNSKPMHHAECSLSALLHAWSQSALVDFLPGLPLPSSWSANRASKLWSATRRQRSTLAGAAWASLVVAESAFLEQSSYSSHVPLPSRVNS